MKLFRSTLSVHDDLARPAGRGIKIRVGLPLRCAPQNQLPLEKIRRSAGGWLAPRRLVTRSQRIQPRKNSEGSDRSGAS
jgi:hypothetical protein